MREELLIILELRNINASQTRLTRVTRDPLTRTSGRGPPDTILLVLLLLPLG
jgi:hypothetical protein